MQAATLSLAVGEGGAVSLDLRAAGRPRRAWVTLLSTDSYLRGVQCLARALRAHRSRYPLVVMVTGSVGEDSCAALRAESNCTLRVVEYIRVPSEARARYACAHFADCWTKLSAWAWVEYEQLCYLDADMLPLASLDELLETDVPAGVPLLAVPDCACRQRAMRPHCPFAATPAGGPPRLVRRYFNAGLLVFRPSRDEHAALLQELVAADAATLPFAEQDLLNRRYSLKWMPLSVNYNATKGIWLHHRQRPRGPASAPTAAPEVAMAEGELAPFELELSSVRNLHYTMAKPWQLRNPLNKGFGQINQLWWDAFLRGAPGKGGKGVSVLNKVCMVLAIRAKAAARELAQRCAVAEAGGMGPQPTAASGEQPQAKHLPGLISDSDSDSDAELQKPDEGGAAALAEAAVALESERWCLVADEPAGHLRVRELVALVTI